MQRICRTSIPSSRTSRKMFWAATWFAFSAMAASAAFTENFSNGLANADSGTRYAASSFVAKKSELLKQVQAVLGGIEIANRHSNSLPATLYLMRLRTRQPKIALPKIIRKIAVEMEDGALAICEVKIIQPD